MANNESENEENEKDLCAFFESQKNLCWVISIAAGGLLLGILFGKNRKKKKSSTE